MGWPRQKDAGGENTKINCGVGTTGEKEKGTSKKNVDGRSTSSRGNKKFRTRSMEKQGGVAFGFWKTATAVIKPDREVGYIKMHGPLNVKFEKSIQRSSFDRQNIPQTHYLYAYRTKKA